MAATGAIILYAGVNYVLPKASELTFRGIDRAQNTFTVGANVFKYYVAQPAVARVLQMWARARGTEVNHWNERFVLPTLPLPTLVDTAERARVVFLRILPANEHERVNQECDALVRQAWGLQCKLMLLGTFSSWINYLWQTGAYSCNSNPLRGQDAKTRGSHWVGFDRDDGVEDYSQFKNPVCVRGGVLLHALATYNQKLIEGTTNEDLVFRYKRNIIDASSCLNAFSFRLPGEQMDTYQVNYESRHVMIEVNGYYYRLDLFDEGVIKSPEWLAAELEKIITSGEAKDRLEFDVSTLTTGKRNEWHAQRQDLLLSNTNRDSLSAIESSLCIIHLDPADSWTTRAEAAEFLYKQRTRSWDDVLLSIRVKRDGSGMVCSCGHGNADATAVAPLIEFSYRLGKVLKPRFDQTKTFADIPNPSALAFELEFTGKWQENDATMTKQVNLKGPIDALQTKPMNEELKVRQLEYTTFTKEKCKAAGINPDGTVQQAFQLAWARTFESDGVEAYQAASLRGFCARTEQPRPYSESSITFVKGMKKVPRGNQDDDIDALTAAVAALDLQKTEVTTGRGFDRHLFALYVLAQKYGVEIPLLDTYIDKIFHNKLSTSQLPQDFGAGGIFPPTEEDGIGIFYPISRANIMRFYVSSYLDEGTLNRFVQNLKQALDDINVLLDAIIARRPPPSDVD